MEASGLLAARAAVHKGVDDLAQEASLIDQLDATLMKDR
jgi:hypothetical protein